MELLILYDTILLSQVSMIIKYTLQALTQIALQIGHVLQS